MIKLETLKLLFNDLSRSEKLVFEEWVKRQIEYVLIREPRNEKI